MMRTSLKILLLSLAMSPVSSLALAAELNTSGGAIPGTFNVPEKKDWVNPKIISHEDPSVDCVSNITGEDEAAARRGGVKLGKSCMSQADAFTRAGEAASYLAHYYQRYTPYANEMREIEKNGELKAYQQKIRNCVTGQGACDDKDKSEVLKAMVQYNFGKEIRAQVIEGRTRSELMKSVDLGPQGWRAIGVRNPPKILTKYNALKTGSLRKSTFRLDLKKLVVVDPNDMSMADRQKLGSEYLTHFNEFIDSYSKTTATHSRWHYVSAKSSALGAENIYRAEWDDKNQDSKLGKTLINKNRHGIDQRSQNTQTVNEIVKSFKDDLHKDQLRREVALYDPATKKTKKETKTVHPGQVAVNDIGLGLATDIDPETGTFVKPKDVAAGLVVTINKAIQDTEDDIGKKREARVPSSASGASQSRLKYIPTVSVNVEKFDRFLDAIWPADVALPK